MSDRVAALLASPRVGLLAVGIAIFLSLPSVPTGWYLDDLLHRAQFLEIGPMTDSSNMTHRMYDFLSGDRDELLAYKDLGVLPWWSDDALKIRFWRPLSHPRAICAESVDDRSRGRLARLALRRRLPRSHQ